MYTADSTLLVGMRGHVVALDRTTGAELWRTKLKRADFVTVTRDERRIYAATGGEVFCLDPVTGAILWNNPMRGLGFGLTTLVSGGDAGESLPVLTEAAKRAARRRHAAT